MKLIDNNLETVKNHYRDWNPSFISYKTNPPTVVYYEKNWFCNHNKIIHHSEKEIANCIHCMNIIDKTKDQ